MITIKNEIPAEVYIAMRVGAGWRALAADQAERCLKNASYLVSAWDGERPVGMARVVSDMGYMYVLADVIVIPEYQGTAKQIVDKLGSHEETFNHSKHIHFEECKNLGIIVTSLETMEKRTIDNCKDLQDCVLTIHHTYMHTFSQSSAVKIVENHLGSAMIINMQPNIAPIPVNVS